MCSALQRRAQHLDDVRLRHRRAAGQAALARRGRCAPRPGRSARAAPRRCPAATGASGSRWSAGTPRSDPRPPARSRRRRRAVAGSPKTRCANCAKRAGRALAAKRIHAGLTTASPAPCATSWWADSTCSIMCTGNAAVGADLHPAVERHHRCPLHLGARLEVAPVGHRLRAPLHGGEDGPLGEAILQRRAVDAVEVALGHVGDQVADAVTRSGPAARSPSARGRPARRAGRGSRR